MGEAVRGTIIDTSSTAFARRLGNLLIATREHRGVSPRSLVRDSGGRFTRFDLKAIEAGTMELDDIIIDDVVELYQADIGAILPLRLPVVVSRGLLTAGGVSTSFAPDDSLSLLRSYLLLVRSMRRQKAAPSVDLRREDVESIAAYLGETGEAVVMRLGALMGATRTQRTAMASLFTTGALVIGLVGSVAAGGPADEGGGSMAGPSTTISAVYGDSGVGSPVGATEVATTTDQGDVAAHSTKAEFVTFVADDDVPSSGDSAAADEAEPSANASASDTTADDGTAGNSGSGTSAIGEPAVLEPGADDTLDTDLLTYTPVVDPITFVLEPIQVDVGEPPVPTSTVDPIVETGMPPLAG
jgi:hypothetical protein